MRRCRMWSARCNTSRNMQGQFGVQAEDYAIVKLFLRRADRRTVRHRRGGLQKYGLPKPGAMLLELPGKHLPRVQTGL